MLKGIEIKLQYIINNTSQQLNLFIYVDNTMGCIVHILNRTNN